MAQIDVVPATGLARFLTYNRLPRLLYTGAKGFAPPLDVERWVHGHLFNPHFKLLVEARKSSRAAWRSLGRPHTRAGLQAGVCALLACLAFPVWFA